MGNPMSYQPFISVCCSTYNRPGLLADLIGCFECQTYPQNRCELVILDDAGQYPDVRGENWRIVSIDQKFQSLGEKRNHCFSLIRPETDFITNADDDDLFFPHWLESLATHAEDYDLIHAPYLYEGHPTGRIYKRSARDWLSHSMALVRKEFFTKVGGYPPISQCEDCEFIHRVVSAGARVFCLPKSVPPFYVRRMNVAAWHACTFTRSAGGNPDFLRNRQEVRPVTHFQPADVTRLLSQVTERYRTMSALLQNDDLEILEHIHHHPNSHGLKDGRKLGHTGEVLRLPATLDDWQTLSFHAPAELKIRVLRPIKICATMNASGAYSPYPVLFWISHNFLGHVFGPTSITDVMTLPPGDYDIAVETTGKSSDWKHTVLCYTAASG